MSRLGNKFALATALLTGAVLAPASGQATEPTNNTPPYASSSPGFRGPASVFTSNAGSVRASYIGFESITPTGDVDYHVLTCQGRVIRGVAIDGNGGTADLDLVALDLGGVQLGLSQSNTASEFIDVSAFGKQAVVIKVYGFLGAVAPSYNVSIDC